jgi:hypothetical protein
MPETKVMSRKQRLGRHLIEKRSLERFPLSMKHIRSCGSSWRIHLAGRHLEDMRFGSRGSTERSAAFRSKTLSFAKSCSIGLKSGD